MAFISDTIDEMDEEVHGEAWRVFLHVRPWMVGLHRGIDSAFVQQRYGASWEE